MPAARHQLISMHKSGFVNIVGRPNVGKSTLMNALVGERMSIISNKPQTTRHRLIGILSGDDFQIVFSDTPGLVRQPAYKMHESMNRYVSSAFEDADLMLMVTEVGEVYADDDPLLDNLRKLEVPRFLVINKMDLTTQEKITELINDWQQKLPFTEVFAISALLSVNTAHLLEQIVKYLPEGPAYYPKDQLTDRPERFFVSEIIREKIMELYQQEIPYSTEVGIEWYEETETKDGEPLARIGALIYVMRKTQKPIIIGKNGESVKKLGMEARKAIEAFLGHKVYIELFVKVRENWRDDERLLHSFGYQ
jgi:GTP-binding protein Era